MLPQKLKFSEAASTEVKELFKTKHEGRIATCPFRTWKLVTIINQPDDVKFRNIILDANGDDLVGWTTEGGNFAVRSLRVPKSASTPKPVGTAPAEGVEEVVNTPLIITYLSQGGGVWKPWPEPEVLTLSIHVCIDFTFRRLAGTALNSETLQCTRDPFR